MALEEKHWVRLNSTVAYFAMWALRQSPYGWPDDLQLATCAARRRPRRIRSSTWSPTFLKLIWMPHCAPR